MSRASSAASLGRWALSQLPSRGAAAATSTVARNAAQLQSCASSGSSSLARAAGASQQRAALASCAAAMPFAMRGISHAPMQNQAAPVACAAASVPSVCDGTDSSSGAVSQGAAGTSLASVEGSGEDDEGVLGRIRYGHSPPSRSVSRSSASSSLSSFGSNSCSSLSSSWGSASGLRCFSKAAVDDSEIGRQHPAPTSVAEHEQHVRERKQKQKPAAAPAAAAPAAAEEPAQAEPAAAAPGRLSAEEFRKSMKMVVHAGAKPVPEPVQDFAEAGFPPRMVAMMKQCGYTQPTAIQSQTWPIASEGKRDMIAIASTGSGKTAGFALPLLARIHKLLKEKQYDPALGPCVVIMAPTRELARQIHDEAQRFAMPLGIKTAAIYGGGSRYDQMKELLRNPCMLVATPGRLEDFLKEGRVKLREIVHFVVDEADRMLDMGFVPQLKKLWGRLPPTRQTLFFSATWPKEVREVSTYFTKDPVHVYIGEVSDKPVANKDIRQEFFFLNPDSGSPSGERMQHLVQFLEDVVAGKRSGASPPPPADSASVGKDATDSDDEDDRRGKRVQGRGGDDGAERVHRVIMFCKTKLGCERLAAMLQENSGRVHLPRMATLHSDKSQSQRDYTLFKFRRGDVPILIATDVAARGLDIPNVTAVVNYDMPDDVDTYVHRIGRTGRAGKPGLSMTYVDPMKLVPSQAKQLVEVLRGVEQPVPRELLRLAPRRSYDEDDRWAETYKKKSKGGWGGRGSQGGSGGSRYDSQRSPAGQARREKEDSWWRDEDPGSSSSGFRDDRGGRDNRNRDRGDSYGRDREDRAPSGKGYWDREDSDGSRGRDGSRDLGRRGHSRGFDDAHADGDRTSRRRRDYDD